MSAPVRTVVTLPHSSGLPKDASENVWHFQGNTFDACYSDIQTALQTFYTSLASLFSVDVNVDAVRFRHYNLNDPTPRVAHLDTTVDIGTHGTDAYPHELAICLSFQGARVSGTPQARRRGRVYLGPIARVATSPTDPTISPSTRVAIQSAATALLIASNAASSWKWIVWSPSDSAMVPVVGGWIDNAFDVQRRRGPEPTIRTTFP